MKNSVPLIVALLITGAIVLLISRIANRPPPPRVEETDVVATTRQLEIGDVIKESDLKSKSIPKTAQPRDAVPWSKMEYLLGQKAHRPITPGDYVFFGDVGSPRLGGEIVGKGEWAVMVRFEKSTITQIVKPGDDIAVLASMSIEETANGVSPEGAMVQKKTTRDVTTVLLPRVRVISVGSASVLTGVSGLSKGEMTEILMSLPPQQAELLMATKNLRDCRLDIALRRPNDEAALSRSDVNMVDMTTFVDLLKGLKPVQLPDMPYKPATLP